MDLRDGKLLAPLLQNWFGIGQIWKFGMLHKEIPILKHISMSRYDASQTRAFFSTTFPFFKPLFYFYADKTSFPQLIQVIPRVDDINHTPSAPQDPSRGHCRLYPMV